MNIHDRHHARHELDSLNALHDAIAQHTDLSHHVVHALDLTGIHDWGSCNLEDSLFLGCTFEDHTHRLEVEQRGAYVFPHLKGLPYSPYRGHLYSVDELLRGYDEGGYFKTTDFAIYDHFDTFRGAAHGVPIKEALAQRLHDHAIDDALEDLLDRQDRLKVVGIMGGHSTSRTDPWYRHVVQTSWTLARQGYFIASGGGPGIMEAANLGAYLSHFAHPDVLDAALDILAEAPLYSAGLKPHDPGFERAIEAYISTARRVVTQFGTAIPESISTRYAQDADLPGDSLAIPTWFYGHEPSNLFSTHIAKYFANSIREDGLLAISLGGVIYAPGSAGTLQEVFMDLAQNHYTTFAWRSPMVFLGSDTYAQWFELIAEFVRQRQGDNPYEDFLALVNSPEEAASFITNHPPRKLK